jgi:glycerol-3-phosphate dehydrogenase
VKPSSLNRARRDHELEELDRGEVVDLLVVGGGATGAGIALDAATRGLSVALVERCDLAFGTSRWSSKLVHGGLRYLAHGQLGLARESATERGVLMERTAPHLTRALGMVAPVGVGFTPAAAARTGLGFVAGNLLRAGAGTARATLPPPRWLGPHHTRLLVPAVATEGLTGALLTWDGQLVDDARLVVAIARTAAAFGARIVTYASAEELTPEGARVRDQLGGRDVEIRARHVVNATGVWASRLHPEVELRPSKGAHLVLDGARLGHPRAALTVPVPGEANRYVFALPQLDGRVYVGLTDDPVDSVSDEPIASEADETFLLSVLSRALERDLTPSDVVGSFAGLRPLLATGDGRTADLSRDHAILEGERGLLTIVGGKLTTYRRMAEDVVDRVVVAGGFDGGPCVTSRQPLVGAAPRRQLAGLAAPRHLVGRYGTEALDVARLEIDPELAAPVVPGGPHSLAELAFAVEHEGALEAADLLDRRTRIGLVAGDRARALPLAERLLAARSIPPLHLGDAS